VILARPTDDEIETIILHAYDDLLDQRTDDTFARGYRRPFRMPGALDVGAEPQKRLLLLWGYPIRRRSAERMEFVLKTSLFLQALVPTPLEFAAISRLSGSTASYCRRACTAWKRACSSADSTCRRFSAFDHDAIALARAAVRRAADKGSQPRTSLRANTAGSS
jgi:hypothetical protein